MDNKLKVAVGFLIGAAAGAAVGILTAPYSGKESRRRLTEKAGELSDDLITKAEENLMKAKTAYNDSVDKAADKSKKGIDNIKTAVHAN